MRLVSSENSQIETVQIGVQSIETGARLLSAMALLGPNAMLKDLAKAAGMPPAKAHRYVVSFVRMGLMEQDPNSGRYGFGPLAFRMGVAALMSQTISRVGPPQLAALRAQINETVALSIWGAFGPTFVHVEEAGMPVHLSVKPGSVVPLMTSGTGRIFAAYFDHHLVQPVLAKEMSSGMPAPNMDVSFEPDDVERVLNEVRREGFATVRGRIFNAVSAPVFDHQRKLVAAVTVIGAATLLDVSRGGLIETEVRATARKLSELLGVPDS